MATLFNNLGYKVHTQNIDWGAQVRKSWGTEWAAPDHGVYEFSNGRRFDSTDRGTTGVYNPYNNLGLIINSAQYPDMVSMLLAETGYQLDQN